MSDFVANIKAILDDSGIPSQIKAIEQKYGITIPININLPNLPQQYNNLGANAGQSFAKSFSSSLNKIGLTNGGMGNIQRMLQGAGFDKSSIGAITQDLNKMLLTINKVSTSQMRNGNIRINISGVDEIGRAVTVVRDFDKTTGAVQNTTKKFVQSFGEIGSNSDILSNKIRKLKSDMEAWLNQNPKAMDKYGNEIRGMVRELSTADDGRLREISTQFSAIKSEAKQLGLTVKPLGATIKDCVTQFLGLSSAYMVFQKVIEYGKKAVDTVIELDTAMIELRKTSTMSTNELAQFYDEATESAKKYGVTTKDIISSAADWSQLGYSSKEEAKRMAELSAQMVAISPGMTTEQATKGLVSTMKAYKIDSENVLDGIMSKINIVGNTAATSNDQILTGLENSASAMQAMGGSLEENIALFTAAQEITQDASKAGNALRSIALRVRGYDEETEQYSEDLIKVTGEVVNLTKTADKPNGISLFTDASQTQYKSIYQYLKEISQIYNDLSAKNRQTLLEKLFGKNRASVGASILSNFDAAEKAMNNMSNSAGGADKEMAIATDSITYHLNTMNETWVQVAKNLADSSSIKAIVDALTVLAEVIDGITKATGGLGTALIGITAFKGIKGIS